MNWWAIPENLASDIILGAIIFAISWLVILATHKIPLQKFFNVTTTKRLVIYISNIKVQPFGSIGLSGKPVAYARESVNYGEMKIANQFQGLFSFLVPQTEEAFKTIGKLLFSDISVQIISSPKEMSDLDTQAPFIAIGSPVFNAASAYIENTNRSIVKFKYGEITKSELETLANPDGPTGPTQPIQALKGDTGISMLNAGTITAIWNTQNPDTEISPSGISLPTGTSINPIIGPIIPAGLDQEKPEEPKHSQKSEIIVEGIPPFSDTTYGFVERIKDPNSDRMLFYAAGISELSSTGAANYLARQWKDLYKKYKDKKPFFIMLKFDNSDINKWSIKLERELSN